MFKVDRKETALLFLFYLRSEKKSEFSLVHREEYFNLKLFQNKRNFLWIWLV